jgi:8-oxo-dGTP pyrophosphatase MutT (NUDIX family)
VTGDAKRVAAVCYRRVASGAEFLLVGTKSYPAWTFPKGKIDAEDGGDPRAAVAREAREEAGVTGRAASRPLTRYRYPAGEGQEHLVDAYLLEVDRQQEPRLHEREYRHPRWFPEEEARERLAENREPPYAEEHARVLAAAVREIAATA